MATPPKEFAVDVERVVKSYAHSRERALDGISLRVARREFVAITGPSGSGKSTLLHLLAALDRPDQGAIRVNGFDVVNGRRLDRYRRSEVGLVFQLHNLLPHLDARRNVEVAMIGGPLRRNERRRRAADLLAAVDLGDMERRYPPELSGGERQRVAIARALANEPALLLADEPTGSLDEASVERVLRLLRQLRDERSLTIVMVTHDRDVAATTDRTVTIDHGNIIPGDPSPRAWTAAGS